MASRADAAAWRVYVAGELAKFYGHCDGITYIWRNTPEANEAVSRLTGTRYVVEAEDAHGRPVKRAQYVGGDSELSAFTGPWHVVRPHVTQEFRQWVEEHEGTERLTLSQWVERQRSERADVAYIESATHTLGQLEEIARLMAERDGLILEAARRGASKVAIAAASGITRQQVHAILSREIDALETAGSTLAPVTPITAAHGATVPDADASEWRQLASGEWVEVF